MSARIHPLLAALLLFAVGCGGGGDGEQQMSAAQRDSALRSARADSVRLAIEQYDPAAFDTIQWSSWEERVKRGETVWRWSCAKCHGAGGTGEGDLAEDYGFDMPNLVAEGWQYAGQPDSVRRRIYVGHESEMPSWGLYGLSYRDVDATVEYILGVLRSS